MTRIVIVSLMLTLAAACATPEKTGAQTSLALRLSEAAAAAYARADVAEATALYARVAELSPTDSLAWTRLGNLAFLKGDAQRATANYQKAVSVDSGNSEAWRNLAAILMDQAEAALQQASSSPQANPQERLETRRVLEALRAAKSPDTQTQALGHARD